MKVKKAVIPAAGLGTRVLPATKAIPKEMIPILDKPAIQYIVEEAVEAGIEEILIITNRGKEAIENHFDVSYELENILTSKGNNKLLEIIKPINSLAKIYFIRQQEAKGLGHAVGIAKEFVRNEPFAVLLGDDIYYHQEKNCLKSLIEEYDKKKSSVFALLKVDFSDVNKYGIIDGYKLDDSTYEIKSLVEKPEPMLAPTNLAVMGRYVFTSKIFDLIEETTPGKGGEIQLTDAMNNLAAFEKMYGYIFPGFRYDTGNLIGYLKTIIDFGLRRDDIKEDLLEYLKEKI